MNLYFIAAEEENGENLDLMIEAADRAEAVRLWDSYYERTLGPSIHHRVFQITPTGSPGALAWHTPTMKEI